MFPVLLGVYPDKLALALDHRVTKPGELKNIYVLIYLSGFINFCTKFFYNIHELFPYQRPENQSDLAIKKARLAKGHHYYRTFWHKSLQNFP